MPVATPTCQERFLAEFDNYITSVVQQAEDRSRNRVRDTQSYMDVRRDTIGAYPSFALLELDMSIPNEVMAHPTMRRLVTAAVDMISLGNVRL